MAIKVGMVSLGCSKNQVDAEILLALMLENGYEICADPQQCDVVIINTCGFIEDAKKESIETIFEFAQLKNEGQVKVLVVTGCLAERYQDQLVSEIPEADVVLGIGKNTEIAKAVKEALDGHRVAAFGDKADLPLNGDRVLSTEKYSAYLKIAEGCDNRCSFCAIPLIRGGYRSRRMEDILEEARGLAESGVKELNLVAQDTTKYGQDLYGEYALDKLLTELCKIDGFHWIRVLYGYPDRVTDGLLEVMAREPKVVKYIDLPLQHASGKVLKEMNRKGDFDSLCALMQKIRDKVPGVVLRTTLIAGFPGETEEQYSELCDFVKTVKFDRLGCFAYSAEENTVAAKMDNQIDEEVKQRRADHIMELQAEISAEKEAEKVGKTYECICDGVDDETGMYLLRSAADCPEIDGSIMTPADTPLEAGAFYNVTITDADTYDLYGYAESKVEE